MTGNNARIEGGFAQVEAGRWLAGRGQPSAFLSSSRRIPRKGWRLRDRASLDLVETSGRAWFSDASRPFLTHIPCAATINAVSGKVLVAPESARLGAEVVKTIPMSARGSLIVTKFGIAGDDEANASGFVVMATASRTIRVVLGDGETLSVRPGALVAWTGNAPTGFCRKISILDVFLPRVPRDLLLTFYGPGVVWIEGIQSLQSFQTSKRPNFNRRAHGI